MNELIARLYRGTDAASLAAAHFAVAANAAAAEGRSPELVTALRGSVTSLQNLAKQVEDNLHLLEPQPARPRVEVRCEQRHGTYFLYPNNPTAEGFCKLSGTKTLPWGAVDHIKALGYDVIDVGQEARVL